MTVRELAGKLGLRFEGTAAADITGAASVETAGAADITFAGPKAFAVARDSNAACVIAPADYERPEHQTVIRADNPRRAFAGALRILFPPEPLVAGIDPTALIAPSATVDPTCEIGPCVTIGPDAVIEPMCRIEPGCRIGAGARVGSGSHLHPNVTLYAGVTIGSAVVLHSGVVIGADGFGFVLTNGRYEKFPQVGTVIIADHVEIGANSCVDRAALGVTYIGEGTKLDNMVHIGHNCRIGRHVVIAAQTGLSGGVVIEDHAVIGGQVGIGDKARIESGAIIGSGAGILTSKIVKAGTPMWGTPARPLKEHLEGLAHVRRLPALREEITDLRRRLAELEAKQEKP